MAIEGSLREFAVQDIFQLMYLSRKTGELVIIREPHRERGSVVFDSGAVVRADVEGQASQLGHLLLNAGKITEADLVRAEAIHEQSPLRDWTEIFPSMGVIGREEMEKYVKFLVEELVLEMLDWQDGTFSFGERGVEESEKVTWIPTESLLIEGARRADELSALPTSIASNDTVPRYNDGASEGGTLDLLPEEWELLGQIDGAQDLRTIAWALGRSEFEVSKVVSKLVGQGLLEIGPPDVARTRPPHEVLLDHAEELIRTGDLEKAQGRVDSVLRDHTEEPRALYLRALISERLGKLAVAVAGYEKTISIDPLAADARLRLGLLRFRGGDLRGALNEWTSYLRMSQDSPEKQRVERAVSAATELQGVLDEIDGRDA